MTERRNTRRGCRGASTHTTAQLTHIQRRQAPSHNGTRPGGRLRSEIFVTDRQTINYSAKARLLSKFLSVHSRNTRLRDDARDAATSNCTTVPARTPHELSGASRANTEAETGASISSTVVNSAQIPAVRVVRLGLDRNDGPRGSREKPEKFLEIPSRKTHTRRLRDARPHSPDGS